MHKRYLHGFTIVELLIVVTVIIIITTVGAVTYTQVQVQSRDAERNADITQLVNALETYYDRKGEYPPGCPETTCTSVLHTANTSSAPLTSAMTLTTLIGILPNIKDKFGDPQSPNATYPFKSRTVNEKKYLYFGGTYNNTTGTLSVDVTTNTNFPCTLRSNLAAGAIGSYVVGYFNEKDSKWVLRGGRNGIAMTVAAGLATDGCVINR